MNESITHKIDSFGFLGSEGVLVKNAFTTKLNWLVIFWIVTTAIFVLLEKYVFNDYNKITQLGIILCMSPAVLIINIYGLNQKVKLYKLLYLPFLLFVNSIFIFVVFPIIFK